MNSDEIWWGVVPKGMNFDIFSGDLTVSICSDIFSGDLPVSICSDFTLNASDGT
jgi:hypothetical protein